MGTAKVRRKSDVTRPSAAEFFAGIGLVRTALDAAGIDVTFANDIEPAKARLYAANHPADHFRLGDVRRIRGGDVPSVDLAAASFPCTDLSLAGNRAGLAGGQSGMFWEFARVLEEMGRRRPAVVMLENVLGFATSHEGRDLRAALERLNALGYVCDVLVADAKWFVPQSRPRMFIIGSRRPVPHANAWDQAFIRPAIVRAVFRDNPDLQLQAVPLPEPPVVEYRLGDFVERMKADDARWWDRGREVAFARSLSRIQSDRLRSLRAGDGLSWATAYRRTREGRAVWEIRGDGIAGCLRTASGGSSKQAVVEAGRGKIRLRWMTPREYARLQGAPDFNLDGARTNEAIFGFGDAVCVPVVEWLARVYVRPLLLGTLHRHPGRIAIG